MITLEVLTGDNDRRDVRARPAGADDRPRSVEPGGAVRLSPVGRARSDLSRGRSLHLSRPAVDQRLAHPARRAARSALDDGSAGRRPDRRRRAAARRSAEPVVLRCRVKIEDDGRGKQEIIARRTLSELPEVQGKIERDPLRAARPLQRGQEARAARARPARRCSRAWPRRSSSWCRRRPTWRSISPTSGRLNTVFTKSAAGGPPALTRQPLGRARGAARKGRAHHRATSSRS